MYLCVLVPSWRITGSQISSPQITQITQIEIVVRFPVYGFRSTVYGLRSTVSGLHLFLRHTIQKMRILDDILQIPEQASTV